MGVFEDGRISTSVLRAELSCQGNLAFSVFPTSSSTSSTRGNIRRFPHPSFLDGRGEEGVAVAGDHDQGNERSK